MAKAVLVAGVLVLAACGSGSSEVTATNSPSTTTSPEGSTTISESPSTTNLEDLTIEERARRLGLFDDLHGEYFGPVDSQGRPFLLPPMEGYADFSDITPQERFDLDLGWLDRLKTQCVIDHGFGDGVDEREGFNLYLLPTERRQMGMATAIACYEGLHFPKSVPRTRAMWEEVYSYQLAWRDCAAEYGYVYERYPTLEELIALQGNFEHDDYPLSVTSNLDFQELYDLCPPDPIGGFGAWNPGDPINPAP